MHYLFFATFAPLIKTMKHTGRISHQGVVVAVREGRVTVRLVVESACGSCQLAGKCASAASDNKLIEVKPARSMELRLGQTVTVSAPLHAARFAVGVSFVAPLLLLMAVLVGGTMAGLGEMSVVGAAVVVLAAYYGVWALLRKHIDRRVSFTIDEKES